MLPVYYEDRIVGHIAEEKVGVAFAYAQDWLAGNDAFPISLTMPLREDRFPPETATPWFANLLPEERQLERIGRLLGRGQGDVYGLLEEIGRDTAGALSIGAPEPTDHADYHELDEASLADAIARLPARPLLAGEEGVTMSLAGAQSKLPVAVFGNRIALPMYGAASTHILKPESDRLHASVENELLCMRLAAQVGVQSASTSMGIADGRKFLLVERYDRDIRENFMVERGHQEDFCQALGLYPTNKYEARGGPRLKDLFKVLDRNSRVPARDRLCLLDIVIFACCIGDTDRHGKNFSLILTDGGPRLAPGYDLMTGLTYEGITRNMAMKIADKRRAEYIERRHWQRFAREVELAPAATVHRVELLATAISDRVVETAATLAADFPANRAALDVFAQRIRERASLAARNSQRDTANERDDC